MEQTVCSSEPPDCVFALSVAAGVSAAAAGPSAGPGSLEWPWWRHHYLLLPLCSVKIGPLQLVCHAASPGLHWC